MKKFFFLSLFLIGFAFLTVPVSGSAPQPPFRLAASVSQQQLDPIATICTIAEQTVTVTIQPFSYAYQVQADLPEIAELSNLVALNSTTPKQNPGQLSLSMRHQARNAVISGISFSNRDHYNPNALIRML